MRTPLAALVLAFTAMACGDAEPEASTPPVGMEEAVAQLADRAQAGGASAVEPRAAADLATQLPDVMLGMTASNRSQQNVGAMGMKMSMASAEYRSDERQIDASLTDVGGVGTMAPMAAAWSLADFDRTTADGYERTIRFDGYKGMESSSRSGGRLRTELSLLVGDRIIVKLEGREVDVEMLKAAARELNLTGLARGS